MQDGSFEGCTALTTLVVPGNVRHYDSSAWGEYSNLANITAPVYSQGAIPGTKASGISLTINGNGPIEVNGFYDCQRITTVHIGEDITEIGEEAFYGSSVTTAYFDGNSTTWNWTYGEYNPYTDDYFDITSWLKEAPGTKTKN